MNKIEEIFKSWRISFNPDDDQVELAKGRIEICDSCEFKEEAGDNILRFTRCTVCGCVLKGKIYTPKTYLDEGGSCPKEKWKDVEDEWLKNKE